MAQQDELRLTGVMAQGYGVMPKSVMQDPRLTIEAKAIYAYIASFAGAGVVAFPGKAKIAADLKISEERLYTHRKQLIKCGYISVRQERGPGGTLGKTVYTLEPIAIERPDTENPSTDEPCTEKPRSEKPRTENPSHNNNSFNNNNLKNNSNKNNKSAKPTPKEVVELYHAMCPSFSRIVKVTDGRATAIKARLDDYSIEQIQQAFRMAESSDFLKGKNDRQWKATFDWIFRPGNMAKILEGNYTNRANADTKAQRNTETYYKNLDEEETL